MELGELKDIRTLMASGLYVEVSTTEMTLVFIPALWYDGCRIVSPLENLIKADSSNRSPGGLM